MALRLKINKLSFNGYVYAAGAPNDVLGEETVEAVLVSKAELTVLSSKTYRQLLIGDVD